MFDSADAYSGGLAETILGEAIKGKRQRLILSTKVTFPVGENPNDYGSSRLHLIKAVDASLNRLGVDHVDLLHLHGPDYNTPVEETLATLDRLVADGKVQYIGVSNFSGWHLMKSLAASERLGFPRYVAHQVYYSLLDRDYEWELMALGKDQGVGATVWSPLSMGKLTGKIRRGQPPTSGTRAYDLNGQGPQAEDERLFAIIDVLDELSRETGRSVPQVALNWLLQRPTVASVIIGARNEKQLLENANAVGWSLSAEQVRRLETVSEKPPIYPVSHQRRFPMLNEDALP